MAVRTITFFDESYPEVIKIANELGELEQRRPHDSIKMLIIECGKKKVSDLKQNLSNGGGV